MNFDVNKVEEVRQNINNNVFNLLNDSASKVKDIRTNLPRTVSNKKMNDYKLYNLNRKIENINSDVSKITSLLYKSVSNMQNAESKIAKFMSDIGNISTVKKTIPNSGIMKWDSYLKSPDKVSQWFKDTGSEITNWFTTKVSGIPGIFQKLKDTGAKISTLFKRENKSDVLNVADESFDEGLFEKTTLSGTDGSRMVYAKKKEENGNINYYDKKGYLLKSILADETVVIYNKPGILCHEFTKYFSDGTSILIEEGDGIVHEGTITYYDQYGKEYKRERYSDLKLDNVGKVKPGIIETLKGEYWEVYKDDILIQKKYVNSDSYINYYKNGNIEIEVLDNGTRKEYHENGNLAEEYIDYNNTKKFDEQGKLTYERKDGKTIFERYENGNVKQEIVNGQLIKYHDDGSVWTYDGNSHMPSGMETAKKLSNGTLQIINNGRVVAEIFPDGTGNNYWYATDGSRSSTPITFND